MNTRDLLATGESIHTETAQPESSCIGDPEQPTEVHAEPVTSSAQAEPASPAQAEVPDVTAPADAPAPVTDSSAPAPAAPAPPQKRPEFTS
jgi:hypothetical protein